MKGATKPRRTPSMATAPHPSPERQRGLGFKVWGLGHSEGSICVCGMSNCQNDGLLSGKDLGFRAQGLLFTVEEPRSEDNHVQIPA